MWIEDGLCFGAFLQFSRIFVFFFFLLLLLTTAHEEANVFLALRICHGYFFHVSYNLFCVFARAYRMRRRDERIKKKKKRRKKTLPFLRVKKIILRRPAAIWQKNLMPNYKSISNNLSTINGCSIWLFPNIIYICMCIYILYILYSIHIIILNSYNANVRRTYYIIIHTQVVSYAGCLFF